LLGDAVKATQILKNAGVPTQLIILEGQSHNHSAHSALRDGVFTPDIIVAKICDEPQATPIDSTNFSNLYWICIFIPTRATTHETNKIVAIRKHDQCFSKLGDTAIRPPLIMEGYHQKHPLLMDSTVTHRFTNPVGPAEEHYTNPLNQKINRAMQLRSRTSAL